MTRLRRLSRTLFPAAAIPATALLLAGCAHMEAPPGGPADTKRPYVTAVFPAPDTVGAPRDLKARIVFSEWVAPDAERGKVYLNPPLDRRLKVRLSGNAMEVTSAAGLDSNTTYTLGLLETIKDLNGQPLESPLQLTFATGPALDSGRLKGLEGVFQARTAPGAFAALYPRGAELRARFRHLTRRNDSAVVPSAQPDPLKERPAYIAPADSQGRFSFKGLRPGRYGLLGFQDVNGDLNPNAGSEALAIGPSVDVSAAWGEPQVLALAPYDTVPVRLAEAHWAGEGVRNNLAYGTVRLKFNRPPHPTQCLRREAYAVRRLGPKSAPFGGAPVPVQDVCLNPNTGEVELMTAPLDADSQYVASCPGLRDQYGNLADTARNRAQFRVDRAPDTAKPDPVFLGPRKVSGEMPRMTVDNFLPGRPLTVYYPRLLADSTLNRLRANLIVKADTLPVAWTLARLSHHEFSLQVSQALPLKGQRLSLAWKPPDSAAAAEKDSLGKAKPQAPQPAPIVTFSLADAAKLGSVKFAQDPSAYGSRLVVRAVASGWEYSRVTPAAPEFTVDSLPEGNYAVDYFRDGNGDGIWNPGSLAPWAIQEPYALFADSVDVKAGGVNRGDVNKKGVPAAKGVPFGTGIPATPGTPASASPGAAPVSSTERKLSWPPAW
ncbi:MAG TPA: Ig-like domain-containing domain [Fibrobacteria bacterium]|nr:Ig-like domain-containing domain [Fibrobacteria bacterium]